MEKSLQGAMPMARRRLVVGLLVASMLLTIGPIARAEDEAATGKDGPQRHTFSQPHMGTLFTLIYYTDDRATAQLAATAAFKRIEALDRMMSDYDPESELSRLSQTSGTNTAMPLSNDLYHVLDLSQQLSRHSNGGFDVTIGPLVRLWRQARRAKQLPTAEQLQTARSAVGYDKLILKPAEQACQLETANMKLDLGGIAKGYAADQALAVLGKHGCRQALVNASGDIALGDAPPGKTGWKIGVAPLNPDDPPSRLLRLANMAIATSGDAWQFVEIDGQRYSHIVDPRTGVGLTDRSSVTVLARDCTHADALATAVSVLGPASGVRLIDQTNNTEAIVVWVEQNEPRVRESRGVAKIPTAD